MWKMKCQEHKWPGGEHTIEGRNEIFTYACLISMGRDFSNQLFALSLGSLTASQAAENNKEYRKEHQSPLTLLQFQLSC